ncbi:MAG: Nuclease SbcCD subunit [Gemmataceae bacterium]|nr:Nuclease SbcCD subunit [Gemmataceae bacterium]
MRIVHTADWHLCDRLGRIDRTGDLESRVETVAALCAEHRADVLLVAGDLFSEQASVDDMTRALTPVRTTFAAFFARGGTVLAITGNHDRDARINLVRAGMTLAAPPTGPGGRLAAGRFYLVNGTILGTLEPRPGDAVQFVLVPYPFASRYDLSAADYRSREEETRLLHEKVAGWVQGVPAKPGYDTGLPTVLAAHLHVRGAELHTLYKMTERDDVLFDFADVIPKWAYIALGHIHKPQMLGGAEHVRYSGSLDRLDFGETHDDHGVVLVEVNGSAAVVPLHLPIPATPFHTIALADPETDLPALADRYPDRETAIVRVIVSPPAGHVGRDEIARQLRRLFPRLYDLRWADAGRPDDAPAAFTPRLGFEPTVRAYLTERLAADPDRDAVLALAETFLKAPGGS